MENREYRLVDQVRLKKHPCGGHLGDYPDWHGF